MVCGRASTGRRGTVCSAGQIAQPMPAPLGCATPTVSATRHMARPQPGPRERRTHALRVSAP
eukprot:353414-Chlamydomonas_euryale.AAC.13